MSEFSSVSASSYDVEGLVAKLNERAADGWDVVSVVSTGGEVAAILRRGSNGSSPSIAGDVAASAPVAAAASVVEAAPVVEDVPSPVSEPAGWGAEPEPAPAVSYEPTPAVSYEPTPAVPYEPTAQPAVSYEPTPVASYESSVAAASPIEVSTPQAAAPVNPAPVVTTPAGWYPDPSGRFEMRYWDGTAWTEHVSRQGQQFTDPPVA